MSALEIYPIVHVAHSQNTDAHIPTAILFFRLPLFRQVKFALDSCTYRA